jgi:Carboxypeptidase regulatory-like domain
MRTTRTKTRTKKTRIGSRGPGRQEPGNQRSNGSGIQTLLLALCLALPGWAQTSGPAVPAGGSSVPDLPTSRPSRSDLSASRTIEGTVLSATGAPVPGAVVLIKDSKTLQVRSYVAQQDGKYHLYGLSTGSNYQLRGQAQGLSSKTKTVSVFDSHRKVVLNLKLAKKIKS